MVTIKQTSFVKKDSFESAAWNANNVIIGIDEVGRGCLAGPLVVGAVILNPHKKSRLVKDSKLLTESERSKAYDWIINNSTWSVAIIDHRLIDKLNIYQATLLGMRRAVSQVLALCPKKPHAIVVDAMPLQIPYFEGDIIHFIKGERKSISIAAASIVAKVTRDQLMKNFSLTIPEYEFEAHKGYCVNRHLVQCKQLGFSIIHRATFTDHLHFDQDENLSLFEESPQQISL